MKDTVGSCIVGRVSLSGQVKCTPKGSIDEFVIDYKEVIVKNSQLITDAGTQIWIWYCLRLTDSSLKYHNGFVGGIYGSMLDSLAWL